MKIRKMTYGALLAVVAFVAAGCQQTTPPPEEPATTEAVVAPKAPEPAPAPAPAPVVKEEVKPAAVAKKRETHTVSKGECLWTISESSRVYNDPFQWPVIYKANRDQIKDPDLIHPNQVLEIPRGATQSEIDAARHEAKTRGPWSLWDGK